MLQKYLSDVSGVLPPGENLVKMLGMATWVTGHNLR
jgi:hypothetical protein